MAHGDAREGKWRGKMRMEWVASSLALYVGTRSIQSLSADPHSSTVSSRLNWHSRRFQWTRPFRWKTKSGFCACAITFRTCYTRTVLLATLEVYSYSSHSCCPTGIFHQQVTVWSTSGHTGQEEYTVDLHLSGLTGTASHLNMQKFRIIGFFFLKKKVILAVWSGEKVLQTAVICYIFIYVQIKH